MLRINNKNRTYINLLLKIKPIKKNNGTYIAKRSAFISDTTIDNGSRINGSFIVKGEGTLVINKYCAIGSGVKCITSNHDMTYMNLQVALQRKLAAKSNISERKKISIGHNVWIGDSVIILPGVKIGNGAVIGAGSVLTKNIPPYAIAAGNPAKVIKYRFGKEKIEELENLSWWDWSLDEMENNLSYFNTSFKI